jgi:NAD(P)-dependent dehydrogenase (short-subunit alcohol dehydrogenase family)
MNDGGQNLPRTLVVGASSGIGREVAGQLLARGAPVAGAARRVERLVEIPGLVALTCDVRQPGQCGEVVEAAVRHLGGLDAVVYATGLSRIMPIDRADVEEWTAVFETNLFGAALVTRAAIPHLTRPDSEGRAVFLSSDSSERAYPGLVAYSASKAALGRFCQGLADEQPDLRVTEVVVGPTAGTEVADAFDPQLFEEFALRWFEGGYVRNELQTPADAAAVVVDAVFSSYPPARVTAAGAVDGTATTLDEGRRQAEVL